MADSKKKSSGIVWAALGGVALLVGIGAAVALSSGSAAPPPPPVPPQPQPQPQQAPPAQQPAAPSGGSGGDLGSLISEVGPLLQGLGAAGGGQAGPLSGPVAGGDPTTPGGAFGIKPGTRLPDGVDYDPTAVAGTTANPIVAPSKGAGAF